MSYVERVDMEPAFMLHGRAWRETSQIADLISHTHGRVGVVANGARRPKSKWKSAMRPFQPLLVSWSGRGSLYTLRAAEPSAPPFELHGAALMSAFYMNELLLALTDCGDPHPALFAHYGGSLAALLDADATETTLRGFELALLNELGYGLITDHDVASGKPLDLDGQYRYVVDRGPVSVAVDVGGDLVMSGHDLRAIAAGQFDSPFRLQLAKSLFRAVLQRRLGGRVLKSREVYASMRRVSQPHG